MIDVMNFGQCFMFSTLLSALGLKLTFLTYEGIAYIEGTCSARIISFFKNMEKLGRTTKFLDEN